MKRSESELGLREASVCLERGVCFGEAYTLIKDATSEWCLSWKTVCLWKMLAKEWCFPWRGVWITEVFALERCFHHLWFSSLLFCYNNERRKRFTYCNWNFTCHNLISMNCTWHQQRHDRHNSCYYYHTNKKLSTNLNGWVKVVVIKWRIFTSVHYSFVVVIKWVFHSDVKTLVAVFNIQASLIVVSDTQGESNEAQDLWANNYNYLGTFFYPK